MFSVIVENDQSQWSDDTGVLYHFPKRYAEKLTPGTRVVYYKGKLKDSAFAASRLSSEPHYFGLATIGAVYPDRASSKGDLFATIEDYEAFSSAVAIKSRSEYLEAIPPNREANYWRDGVREINAEIYAAIVAAARITSAKPSGSEPPPAENRADDEFESCVEGKPTMRYVTTYERDPRNRKQALAIHGLKCRGCDEIMGEKYGPYAEGLIHIHHIVPVSTLEKPKKIDPATDLVPVCPNCHAVIHKKKSATLSIADIRVLLGKEPT